MRKFWFACLYCLLFFTPGLVSAENQCQFSGKFADLSESRKIQVLNCPVGQTWYSDALTDEDRFALIRMAISSHPTTSFLVNFAEFQTSSDAFPLLEFAVSNGANLETILFLAEKYFEKSRYSSQNLNSGFSDFSQLFGEQNTVDLFNYFLDLADPNLSTTLAAMVLRTSEQRTKIPEIWQKSITRLWQLSEAGNSDALEELIFYSQLDFGQPDLQQRLLFASKQIPDDKLEDYIAGMLLIYFEGMPRSDFSVEYAQYLYEKSLSSELSDLFGPRVLIELGAPIDLGQFEINPTSSETPFERCVTSFELSVFNCLEELESQSAEVVNNKLMPLSHIKHLIDVYPLKNEEEIAQILIEKVFSKNLSLTIKNQFARQLLPSKSGNFSGLPNKSFLKAMYVADKIDKYMWEHFALEIATNPKIDQFSMLSSEHWRTAVGYFESLHEADNLEQRILFDSSGMAHSFEVISQANSPQFFEELDMGLYFSYAVKSPNEMDDIITRALERYSSVFPVKSEEYFDLKYHQILLNDILQTQDELALIYTTISEMESRGFDAQLVKNRLVEKLVSGGEFEKAIPVLEDILEQSVLELKDKDDPVAALHEGSICGNATQLAIAKHRIEGIFPSHLLKIHCFQNFQLPNRIPLIFQSSAATVFLSHGINLTNTAGFELSEEVSNFATYSLQMLQEGSPGDPLLSPFAFLAIVNSDDRNYQIELRERYLTPIRSTSLSEWGEELLAIQWLISAADIAIWGVKNNKFLIDTLDYAIGSFEPQINSSISLAKAQTLLATVDQNSFFNFLEEADLTPQVLSKLYLFHQFAKFGPSEQLIVRAQLLSQIENEEFNSLVTKRELLIERLYFSPSEDLIIADEHQELKDLSRQLALFDYPTPKWDENLINLESLKNDLSPQDLFIDVRHNNACDKLEIFLISNNRVSIRLIDDAAAIKRTIDAFKAKILSVDPTYFEEGQKLYSDLIEPFLESQHTKILIAPSSFLFDLPFSSLVLSAGSKTNKVGNTVLNQTSRGLKLPNATQQIRLDLVHLGEVYELELVTPIRMKARPKTERAYSFLGVGAPAFSGSKNASSVAFNELSRMARNNKSLLANLKPLPGAKAELEALASNDLFEETTLLMGSNATVAAVLDHPKLPHASVISFATHGILQGQIDDIFEPGLALSPASDEERNSNGFLGLTDVLELRLSSEVVILSACDTASSRSAYSPPLSGLASAFLAAGSEKVLASSWEVEDTATKLFMTNLVEERALGKGWSAAKRGAIKRLRTEHPEYSHPYYWAPFLIFSSM